MEEAAPFYQQEGVRLKVRDIAEPICCTHAELSVKGRIKEIGSRKIAKIE